MVSIEKLEGLKVKLSFEVPADEFMSALNEAYHKSAKYFNLPGFRKGKAPMRMIESAYGDRVFFEDAFELVFPEHYKSALEEYDLHPGSNVSLDVEQMERNLSLKFNVTLETPSIELGEYKGIEVDSDEYNVTDEQVEAETEKQIDTERKAQSRCISVERPVENGDDVEIDYSGSVDGVKFDGGTAERQTLRIGSGQFIPGFEEQLIGMNINDERDITVTFPAEYHSDELAGREAVFAIKLHSINVEELPSLDDDFAKDVSEFDTFEEYKQSVSDKAREQLTEQANNKRIVAILGKAIDNATITWPDGLIESEVEHKISSMFSGVRFTFEEYCSLVGYDPEAYKGFIRGDVVFELSSELLFDAVAEAEKFSFTDEELRNKATELVGDAENKSELTPEARDNLIDDIVNGSRREAFIRGWRRDWARDIIINSAS